jgi:hypothetical protein
MRKDDINVVTARLAATVSVASNLRGKKDGPIHDIIPANNSTDAARLNGVEMVHNCRVDGFNLLARDAVSVSATWFQQERVVRTSA